MHRDRKTVNKACLAARQPLQQLTTNQTLLVICERFNVLRLPRRDSCGEYLAQLALVSHKVA